MFLTLLAILGIGFSIPIICSLAAGAVLVELVCLKQIPDANAALAVVSTLSMAFLGPRAFSVDALLFGRRILVSTSSSDSARKNRGT
jgi:hypothetical protein